MRAVALIWYLAVTCMIGLSMPSSAQALKLRFWVVEQNSVATKCAFGQYPSKYGGCIYEAYNAGKVSSSACSDLVVTFTGVGLPSAKLTLSRGYAELDVLSSMILAAREPMVHVSVPGAAILFLPERPDGPNNICGTEMCSTPQELQFRAKRNEWLGFTIVVPPGSCKGAPPTPRTQAPVRPGAKPPTPLHKSQANL